ncbi:trichohyalin-like [Pollicipes pollicipes]|uniref:trichohyalin-like n=1 Tax=Pollicipes pollicipes TaxID=41117 RepID=UPI00188509DD|nr:trichohyalin-like [Pollicipes pollicipes]
MVRCRHDDTDTAGAVRWQLEAERQQWQRLEQELRGAVQAQQQVTDEARLDAERAAARQQQELAQEQRRRVNAEAQLETVKSAAERAEQERRGEAETLQAERASLRKQLASAESALSTAHRDRVQLQEQEQVSDSHWDRGQLQEQVSDSHRDRVQLQEQVSDSHRDRVQLQEQVSDSHRHRVQLQEQAAERGRVDDVKTLTQQLETREQQLLKAVAQVRAQSDTRAEQLETMLESQAALVERLEAEDYRVYSHLDLEQWNYTFREPVLIDFQNKPGDFQGVTQHRCSMRYFPEATFANADGF